MCKQQIFKTIYHALYTAKTFFVPPRLQIEMSVRQIFAISDRKSKLIMSFSALYLIFLPSGQFGARTVSSDIIIHSVVWDLGLDQQPRTVTTGHAGAVGSTDGSCFAKPGLQGLEPGDRVSSIRPTLFAACRGGLTDPTRLIGPRQGVGPHDCTDISVWLAPLRTGLNWTEPKHWPASVWIQWRKRSRSQATEKLKLSFTNLVRL